MKDRKNKVREIKEPREGMRKEGEGKRKEEINDAVKEIKKDKIKDERGVKGLRRQINIGRSKGKKFIRRSERNKTIIKRDRRERDGKEEEKEIRRGRHESEINK